jgi:GPI-anchor transamidase subunit K
MVDTCQANTLYKRFYSPNILCVGSSDFAENSYSHHTDGSLGVAVIDRFTYYTLEFLEGIQPDSNASLGDLVSRDPKKIL